MALYDLCLKYPFSVMVCVSSLVFELRTKAAEFLTEQATLLAFHKCTKMSAQKRLGVVIFGLGRAGKIHLSE